MRFKHVLTAAALTLGLSTMASAQCDGSADIASNAIIDAGWNNIMTGDVDPLIARLTDDGAINSSIENGIKSINRQRPDGFPQCTVLLRSQISDRLVREWVVFGEDGSLGFFASMTVVTIGGSDRVLSFTLDSNVDPIIYHH